MIKWLGWRAFALGCGVALSFIALRGFADERPVAAQFKVAVTPEELSFTWSSEAKGDVAIRELPLHTSVLPEDEARELWRGPAGNRRTNIARFDGARDRLYAKFELFDSVTSHPLDPPQHVTDFSLLPQRRGSLGSLTNKKGVTCVLDVDDVVALGAGQVAENIDIGGLLDWQSRDPSLSFAFEGRKVGLRAQGVAQLDTKLKRYRAAGLRVTGILLNYVRAQTPRDSPLVHPQTDPATVPMGPAAFNTATPEGFFFYRAILHFLVDRYTRDDAAHGHLAGLVIGNEVQSHWSWYHLGLVDPEVLLREYGVALRVADLATRSVHADFPIYLSLDHHWTLPSAGPRRRGLSGIELLEGVATRARREGDFPWHLAHHPYPEDLGRPAFWEDHSTPLSLDAPRVTFQNLEVLAAWLRQSRYLFDGHSRRIALTEQGFHCAPGAEGELRQAAAYALAWKKVQAIPEIESFLYHRHVDHPHEFGLRLGLREHDGTSNVNGIGRRRKIWEVMQKAGTPEEENAFAFALPIVGRKDWRSVVAPMAPAAR